MDFAELLTNASERMDVEYKDWLDLDDSDHQGNLARAAIALANHGGGYVVLGFKSAQYGLLTPGDLAPADVIVQYAQERVQRVLAKYVEPPFEIRCHYAMRPGSPVTHPIVEIPGDLRDPVVAAKSSPNEKSLRKGQLYMRRPGPESAPPRTVHDWRTVVDLFVKRRLELQPMQGSAGLAAPTDENANAASVRSVRDRMSSLPAPTRGPRARPSPEALDASDAYVLSHPISQPRVDSLREQIRESLLRSMPTFVLSEIAGSQRHTHAYDAALRFGSALFSFKGPFVEGSNWVEMREREFALSIERYLLRQFAELLKERSDSAIRIAQTQQAIRAFVRDAKSAIEAEGGRPDLIVIVESTKVDGPDRLLAEDTKWWNDPRSVRGQPLENVTWVHGALEGLPALQIREAEDVDEALVCVVDLEDYELVLANVAEDVDDYLKFDVEAIGADNAARRVTATPSLRESMYRSKYHEDGAFSYEEAVLRMQLMAIYRMEAAAEFREQNRPRTRIVQIESLKPDEPRTN